MCDNIHNMTTRSKSNLNNLNSPKETDELINSPDKNEDFFIVPKVVE